MSDIDRDLRTGAYATSTMLKRLKAKTGIVGESLEGTTTDKRLGIDYNLFIDGGTVTGSHRHFAKSYKGYFCLRYSRKNNKDTDFQKLWDKPDNHLYSFSWGWIDETRPIHFIAAGALKRILIGDGHEKYQKIDPFGDGNLFILIPVGDIPKVRIV